MQCAPSFVRGPWDVVVVPAAVFFSQPELRRTTNLVVYGEAHLFRAAWLAGAQEFLREPWEPEELFLRLRGPRPASLEWTWEGRILRLEGNHLSTGTQSARLTAAEAEMLRILVQRRGVAVSRGVLGWAASCSGGRVVDTLVARLRARLRNLTGLDDNPVPGVRSLGYRLP